MNRIKSVIVAFVSVLGLLVSAAPAGAAASPASSAPVPAWACTYGYSCYYDSVDGENKLFTAGRCGEHDLRGGKYHNRINSVANYGNGTVWLYIWRNAGYWELYDYVLVGELWNIYSNDIDRIVIDC
ncbi:hypothetical protein AB0G04_10620 [Actinoplanes sp. NPDC023801]|uniref:hypothetical protein n=1 Tax=Actinoplanes sp. NPDC023801 TaxID=3154595 RepID=UPI0033C8A319